VQSGKAAGSVIFFIIIYDADIPVKGVFAKKYIFYGGRDDAWAAFQ